MGSEYVFYMLDDAITLLPQTKLRKLIAQYLNPAELRPHGERKEKLLANVKAFQKASLTGKYYQAFSSILRTTRKSPAARSLGLPIAVAFLSDAWLIRRRKIRRRYAKPSRSSLVC
jgi:hypothetical protein